MRVSNKMFWHKIFCSNAQSKLLIELCWGIGGNHVDPWKCHTSYITYMPTCIIHHTSIHTEKYKEEHLQMLNMRLRCPTKIFVFTQYLMSYHWSLFIRWGTHLKIWLFPSVCLHFLSKVLFLHWIILLRVIRHWN